MFSGNSSTSRKKNVTGAELKPSTCKRESPAKRKYNEREKKPFHGERKKKKKANSRPLTGAVNSIDVKIAPTVENKGNKF